MGKEIEFKSPYKEKFYAETIQTIDYFHHVTSFVLQTAFPTATGVISNFCNKNQNFIDKLYSLWPLG
jgi:hypothetical protein